MRKKLLMARELLEDLMLERTEMEATHESDLAELNMQASADEAEAEALMEDIKRIQGQVAMAQNIEGSGGKNVTDEAAALKANFSFPAFLSPLKMKGPFCS